MADQPLSLPPRRVQPPLPLQLGGARAGATMKSQARARPRPTCPRRTVSSLPAALPPPGDRSTIRMGGLVLRKISMMRMARWVEVAPALQQRTPLREFRPLRLPVERWLAVGKAPAAGAGGWNRYRSRLVCRRGSPFHHFPGSRSTGQI